MTVASTQARSQGVGNGSQTTFTYTFEINDEADIQVFVGNVKQNLITDYTVAGVGQDGGGTITFAVAPPLDARIRMRRNQAYVREVDYAAAGAFHSKNVNLDMDRLVMSDQQLQEQIDRTIRLGSAEAYQGENMELTHNAAERANSTLGFDENGDLTTVSLPLLTPLALTGQAQRMLRVHSNELGYELRAPSQVRSDIGADNASNLTSGTIPAARVPSIGTTSGTTTITGSDINLVTTGGTQAKVRNHANAVNYVTMEGGAATEAVFIGADGADTHISFVFSPKGGGLTFFEGTGGIIIPKGTTGARAAFQGSIRFNTDTGRFETYDGSVWADIATSSSSDTFSTGDMKPTWKTTPDSGWIMWNDGTIGSASSGASNRANNDTSALYILLWNNCSNTVCPVTGGRGPSAASDFSSNKYMRLPLGMGRAVGVAGTGSSLSPRALGTSVGTETHLLTINEMPRHRHSQVPVAGGLGSSGDPAAASFGGPILGSPTDYTGDDVAHNNMPPTTFSNWMIRL